MRTSFFTRMGLRLSQRSASVRSRLRARKTARACTERRRSLRNAPRPLPRKYRLHAQPNIARNFKMAVGAPLPDLVSAPSPRQSSLRPSDKGEMLLRASAGNGTYSPLSYAAPALSTGTPEPATHHSSSNEGFDIRRTEEKKKESEEILASLIPVRPEELASLTFSPAHDNPRFPPKAVRLKNELGEEVIIIIERRSAYDAISIMNAQKYDLSDEGIKYREEIGKTFITDALLMRTLDGSVVSYKAIAISRYSEPHGLSRSHKRHRPIDPNRDPAKHIKGVSLAGIAYLYNSVVKDRPWESEMSPVFHEIRKPVLERYRSIKIHGRQSPIKPGDDITYEHSWSSIGFMPEIEARFFASCYTFTDIFSNNGKPKEETLPSLIPVRPEELARFAFIPR